jgi:hypothetical protein
VRHLVALLSWKAVGALSALATSLGGFADLFLLRQRDRASLHTILVRWWVWLDDTAVVDFPRAIANTADNILTRAIRRNRKRLVICALTIASSFALTTMAWIAGYWLRPTSYDAITWDDYLPFYPIYVSNFVFDLITVWIFALGIRRLRHATPLGSVALGAAMIAVSSGLAVLSVAGMVWGPNQALKHGILAYGVSHQLALENMNAVSAHRELQRLFGPGTTIEPVDITVGLSLKMAVCSYAWHLGRTGCRFIIAPARIHLANGRLLTAAATFDRMPLAPLLSGATTLIPVLSFSVLVCSAIGVKQFAALTRKTIMRLLEVVTESDPARDSRSFMPGMLLGAACSFISVVVKAVVEVLSIAMHG